MMTQFNDEYVSCQNLKTEFSTAFLSNFASSESNYGISIDLVKIILH